MLKRVGLGDLDKVRAATLAGIVGKLQMDSDAKQLTADFAKTLRLPGGPSLSAEKLTFELQKSGRLDEFFEKLLTIILKQPELSRQASDALARLYLRQTISEEEGVT
jgi:hypothetical protein